jgi:hypothetical protein
VRKLINTRQTQDLADSFHAPVNSVACCSEPLRHDRERLRLKQIGIIQTPKKIECVYHNLARASSNCDVTIRLFSSFFGAEWISPMPPRARMGLYYIATFYNANSYQTGVL